MESTEREATAGTPGGGEADRLRAARSLFLDVAARDLVASFAAAGIPSVLLKGPVLVRWLYQDGAPRPYGDIDLLIPPEALAAAHDAMRELGFTTKFDGWAQRDTAGVIGIPWSRTDGSPVRVDLHCSFKGVTADARAFWQAISESSESMRLGGGDVRVPAEAARGLIVALHGVTHPDPATRAREDLRRALAIAPYSTWIGARDLARRVGAVPALSAGLRLEEQGAAVADRLALPSQIGALIELRLAEVPISHGVTQLVAARGAGARLTMLTREAVPSRAFMRTWRRDGPPRSGVALAAAYPRRAAWLVVQAPRAWWIWRKATRSTRGRSV